MEPREFLLVVSDMHLTEEQPPGGLWKRFLQRDRFVDDDFAALLRHQQAATRGRICLVLNGDIFDFDSVMALPENTQDLSYLERTRSLDPAEPKSVFKMQRIIRDHAVFFDALAAFLAAGHRVVMVAGNHDVETFWPGVQGALRQRLNAGPESLRFEPWAYQHDEMRFEHGHLLDPWCAVDDPSHPVLEGPAGEKHVQVPFGNLVNRYLANLMGFFNPNCTESYQRGIWGYFVFWLKNHFLRLRPLASVWFTGALFTMLRVVRLRRWRTTRRPATLDAPYRRPIFHQWFAMLRELWLDRLAVVAVGALAIVVVAGVVGAGYWLLPAVPGVLVGAALWDRLAGWIVPRSDAWLNRMHEGAAELARLRGVRSIVFGHAHAWKKQLLPGGGYYLNSGTFSSSYLDLACERPMPYSRIFLWLAPGAEPLVMEWRGGAPGRVA